MNADAVVFNIFTVDDDGGGDGDGDDATQHVWPIEEGGSSYTLHTARQHTHTHTHEEQHHSSSSSTTSSLRRILLLLLLL